MDESPSNVQKDELLHFLLQHLVNRGIVSNWANSAEPYSDLQRECRMLMTDDAFVEAIHPYLSVNPIIQQTVETLLAHLAMATSFRWQDVAAILQPLARRGWSLGRWLPTFLIVDGPLGRILRSPDSPLNSILRLAYATYPALAQVRDLFNHDLFRNVRNGVGHWSFLWEETEADPRLVMIDWDTGLPTASITLLEGEALHLVAYSVIEVLDREIFSRLNLRNRT